MNFNDGINSILGKHKLQGFEYLSNYCYKDLCNNKDVIDTEALLIKLDNINYVFPKNPYDYIDNKSCLDFYNVKIIDREPINTIPDIEVNVINASSYDFIGIEIYDCITEKLIIRLGTDNCVGLYPTCIIQYCPENLSCNFVKVQPKYKCQFPDGISIKPDGKNELDPCIYKTNKVYANVIVEISECVKCGHKEVSWYRTPDTVEIPLDEWEEINRK